MSKQGNRKPLRERINGVESAPSEATTPGDAACSAHAPLLDADAEAGQVL